MISDSTASIPISTDKTSGVASWYVLVDGKLATEKPYVNGETSHVLASPVTKGQTVEIIAVDYAGNESTNTLKVGSQGNNGTTGNKKIIK